MQRYACDWCGYDDGCDGGYGDGYDDGGGNCKGCGKMVQLSVLKIEEYGPWTLTLGSDREHELQMLQSRLYNRAQGLFSERGCLVFANRADELFALSSGLDADGHAAIQDALATEFADIRVRMSIGSGRTPAAANAAAAAATREADARGADGSGNHGRTDMIFGGDAAVSSDSNGDVSIMHMDIDGLSGRRRRGASPYEISLLMFGLYHKMSEYFYREHESLAFFLGGDNFMIISSDGAKESGGRRFVDAVERQDGIRLNCGIGSGRNGREAAMRATESLDMIRKMRDESGGGAGSGEGEWPRVYEHATGRRL